MDKLPNLKILTSEQKDTLIIALWEQNQLLHKHITQLEGRIKNLEAQLAKNSRNSHKPPSSDGLKKPNPKSQRKNNGRKTGGQAGHPGSTLEQVDNPDFIEEYKLGYCEKCEHSLIEIELMRHENRQEFEIPPAKMQVTAHHAEVKICPSCGFVNKAKFPNHITQPVQYGKRVRATAIYYGQNQLLPYDRLQEIFRDIHGLPLSEGTLYNTYRAGYEKLESFDEEVKGQIRHSALANFDESGMRVNKKLNWLHVASTKKLTHYDIHEKRGSGAMDEIDILPKFVGRAIHDHWKAYFKYNCKHGLCNSHHLRELTYHHEQYSQAWCEKMAACLLSIKDEVDNHKEAGDKALPSEKLARYEREYDKILSAGLKEIPTLVKSKTKKRGRKKQHPTQNLWGRLSEYKQETLAFMCDFSVPFTNNQGEQDIRMAKVKQKISGCFRSVLGAKIFFRARGYISTMRKHGVNILDALIYVFEDNPLKPWAELKAHNTS